jgi:hypothetical protein
MQKYMRRVEASERYDFLTQHYGFGSKQVARKLEKGLGRAKEGLLAEGPAMLRGNGRQSKQQPYGAWGSERIAPPVD